MLLRMYLALGERKGIDGTFIDETQRGGRHQVPRHSIAANENAYGYSRAKNVGVHRWVRMFRRRSSPRAAPHVPSRRLVIPNRREKSKKIRPAKDLRVDTFRSGGKGGQIRQQGRQPPSA